MQLRCRDGGNGRIEKQLVVLVVVVTPNYFGQGQAIKLTVGRDSMRVTKEKTKGWRKARGGTRRLGGGSA